MPTLNERLNRAERALEALQARTRIPTPEQAEATRAAIVAKMQTAMNSPVDPSAPPITLTGAALEIFERLQAITKSRGNHERL